MRTRVNLPAAIVLGALVALLIGAASASALTRSFAGASADGATVFFETADSLLAADTDSNVDVYQRSGGITTLVSTGGGAFDAGFAGSSADGATVFFATDESLAAGDTDSSQDIYRRQAAVTTLISAGQINGNGAFDASFEGASADGSRVFFSTDEKLINTDNTDSAEDVYERSGGVTTLVSPGVINGNGAFPVFFNDASADGSRVFFHSDEQLVAADTDATQDVYEHSGGVTSRVSAGAINGNGPFTAAFVGASTDGSRVFFAAQEQLTADDTDSGTDIYQRSGGATTKISVGQINGNGANSVTFRGASDDGTRVFFSTTEQLTSADTDVTDDVYERSGGTTSLITIGISSQNYRAVSADGSRVFFTTNEALTPGDTDANTDLYQRQGAFTSLISSGQINGNGGVNVTFEGISSDGTHAFFSTIEKLVAGDTDSVADVYERFAGTTSRVAGQINGNGALPVTFEANSADGGIVFVTSDEQLTFDDVNNPQDVFQRSGGLTTLVSTGAPAATPSGDAVILATSDDAERVFFRTNEQLLPADTDSAQDIYERAGGATTLVSRGQINGNGPYDVFPGSNLVASADGTRVFFQTSEPLVAADTDFQIDLYERSGGTTTLVSAGAINGNGAVDAPAVGASADGSRVFFSTLEQLTGDDTDNAVDLYERSGGTTTRVSAGQINGNTNSVPATFEGASADGSRVFFTTFEQLVSADSDAAVDLYERSGGNTTQVSQGQINGNGAPSVTFAGASDNGTRVFFTSSEQLATGDSDSATDLYERSSGATTRVSAGAINGNGAFSANIADFSGNTGAQRDTPAVSADGSRVFFHTAEQLVAADGDSAQDLYERSGGTTTLISGGPAVSAATASFRDATEDGSHVFFDTAESIAATDTDGQSDLYGRASNVTTQVSTGPVGGNGAFFADYADASQDAASVFFDTAEPLVAADTDSSIDLYERSGGTTTLVSAGQINGNGAAGVAYPGPPERFAVEPGHAVFETIEQLVSADTDADGDIYERIGGRTRLVSTGKSAPAAPSLTLLTASPANDNSPEIGGAAEALSTVDVYANGSCSGSPVANGSAASLASSGITAPAAADTGTTYSATATDATNHVSPCSNSVTFTEDSTAPDTQIDSGPAAGSTTGDSTPTFGVSANEGGSSFECRIDGAAFAACSGPGATHTPAALSAGPHTFDVRATDQAGNADTSPASRGFIVAEPVPPPAVDADPPETTIDKAPKRKSFKRKAKFAFSSDEAGSSFECKLDQGEFASCGASTTFKVKPRKHALQVRATDAAGNTDPTPASATFKVKRKPKRR